MTSLLSRYRGALLGLACGDALGTTNEFEERGTFPPVNDMVGGGRFHLRPGEWTDDTSMAMCLAESLIEKNGFDPRDQMERYSRWWQEGYWSSNGRCFDIGGTVNSALARFKRSGEPFAGPSDPNTAGNGSLMRLAPVVLFYANDPEEAIRMAGESSRTTHGTREAIDACRWFASLMLAALAGVPKREILGGSYSGLSGRWAADPLAPRVAAVSAGSWAGKQPPRAEETPDEQKHIGNSGWVVTTLEAALWAFEMHDDFRNGCLAAANLGGDSDTIAAVYGQLAGAYYGEEGIPAEWIAKLARKDEIAVIAERLAARATVAT